MTTSVVDPIHFDTDPDPAFFSVADKVSTKNMFKKLYFVATEDTNKNTSKANNQLNYIS
jgi:hypothetical protein